MNEASLSVGLQSFYGTECWYRHWANKRMTYTEGVQFFAQHAGNGAFWFLDIVATELMRLHKDEDFIDIKLVVPKRDVAGESKGATIIAGDGNGRELYRREIQYTDCPAGEWEFYLTNGVLLLPSEH